MNKIKIITDSTSDLTDEIYQKHDIEVMSLYVTIGGKTYADKTEISSKELFEQVKMHGELPKSSTIAVTKFHETFKKYLDMGYDIIYIGIGTGFSASTQNAILASQEYPEDRIKVIDSANLSSGIGLLVLKAVKFRDAGDNLAKISQKIEELVPRVRTMFSINTLEYLHKGGRCSGTARIFGTLLKLKPIIRVVDGAMHVAKKPRGKYKVAIEAQFEYVEHDINNIDPDNIMITHCLADDDAVYIKSRLQEMVKVDNIIESYASSVISTHCGPRTIGILYITKE